MEARWADERVGFIRLPGTEAGIYPAERFQNLFCSINPYNLLHHHLRGVSPFAISSFAFTSVLSHISKVSRPIRAASFETSSRST